MPSTTPDFQPNDVWGSTTPTGVEEELTTPSGQKCRAQKMSVESMIEAGILTDTDALTSMVAKHTKKIKGKKGPTPSKADKAPKLDEAGLLQDPDAIRALIGLMDRALPHIVTSPCVRLHYTSQKVGSTVVTKMIPVEDREPGIVYTDQVGFEDKMWLFDWAAGGLGSMMKFRQ